VEEIGNAWRNYRCFSTEKSDILKPWNMFYFIGKKGEDTMRKFGEDQKNLTAVICNGCGKKLKVENGVLKEGCFEGKQVFGYFSSMDGEQHSFDLCEDCYREWTQQFCIPVEKEEVTELL